MARTRSGSPSGALLSLVRSMVLNEGRAEEARRLYPGVDVDALVEADPSSSKKYLLWMAKQVARGARPEDVVPTVALFHRHLAEMPKKDINAYATARELEDAVKDFHSKKSAAHHEKHSRAAGSVSDAPIVYQDRHVILVRLDSKRACVEHGRGTKWCVSMAGATYYETYKMSNVVFYLALSGEEPRSLGGVSAADWRKVAFAVRRDHRNHPVATQVFLADDTEIDPGQYSDAFPQFASAVFSAIDRDAPKQPKGFLARIRQRDYDDEEFVAYWKSLLPAVSDESSEHVEYALEMMAKYGRPQALAGVAAWIAEESPKLSWKFLEYVQRENYSLIGRSTPSGLVDVARPFYGSEWVAVRRLALEVGREFSAFVADPAPDVRAIVAKNGPWAAARQLAADDDQTTEGWPVCRYVSQRMTEEGGSIWSDREAVEALAASEDVGSRGRMAGHLVAEDEWARDLLTALAADPDPGVRRAAVWNEYCPTDAVERALSDPKPEVRRAAVGVAKDRGGMDILPLTRDPDAHVQEVAVDALPVDLLGPEIIRPFVEDALSRDPKRARSLRARSPGYSKACRRASPEVLESACLVTLEAAVGGEADEPVELAFTRAFKALLEKQGPGIGSFRKEMGRELLAVMERAQELFDAAGPSEGAIAARVWIRTRVEDNVGKWGIPREVMSQFRFLAKDYLDLEWERWEREEQG